MTLLLHEDLLHGYSLLGLALTCLLVIHQVFLRAPRIRRNGIALRYVS